MKNGVNLLMYNIVVHLKCQVTRLIRCFCYIAEVPLVQPIDKQSFAEGFEVTLGCTLRYAYFLANSYGFSSGKGGWKL